MKENVFNEKGGAWLNLFMYGYLIVGTIFLARTIGGEIQEVYKSNLTLFWIEKVCTLSFCAFALYTYLALFYKWPNAVYISCTLLGGIILINCANVLYGIANEAGAITLISACQIIIAILWLIFFRYSKEVNSLYPHKARKLFGRDVIICSVFAIISLLFIWATSSKPSLSTTSVVEKMDVTENKQPSLLIEEGKLADNEMTDGISIIRIPQGMKCEIMNMEGGGKLFILTDKTDVKLYDFRVMSTWASSYSSMEFENSWSLQQDSTMMQHPYTIVRNDVTKIKAGKCYRKIVEYQLEQPVIWDYSAVYDYETNKLCLLNAWYREKNNIPIEEVIKNIRFKQ